MRSLNLLPSGLAPGGGCERVGRAYWLYLLDGFALAYLRRGNSFLPKKEERLAIEMPVSPQGKALTSCWGCRAVPGDLMGYIQFCRVTMRRLCKSSNEGN